MSGGHSHGGDGGRWFNPADDLTSARTARGLWIAVAVCAVLTVLGLVVLWPGGDDRVSDPALVGADTVEAVVRDVQVGPCTGTTIDQAIDCRFARIEITSGPDRGTRSVIEQSIGGAFRSLHEGDDILVIGSVMADGSVTYQFWEYQRATPMLLLGLVFVVAVLLLGRWKGLGALGGLAVSLGVLVVFVLPSLLDGNDPVLVALVGASLIAFVALYLAHGVDIATTVALLSTFVALALTGLLSWAFVGATTLTGYTDESTFFLEALGARIDPRGLILAGIVIGTLGVLDDVTVTQVSAVWELRRADPEANARQLYRSALNIGRDHISSTVNTLFLAYAGAALPLLLLFSEARQSISSIATREIVAVEIVRTMVGSIGLVAAVPISTWLAALVLAGRPVGGDDEAPQEVPA